jgi:hypothetical protein
MNNNRPQFVASLCPLLSQSSLLFFPGGLSSSQYYFLSCSRTRRNGIRRTTIVPSLLLQLIHISHEVLPSFQAVYPHLSFRLKLSVIVLVLRCDHRVVVTLGRGLAPQRLKWRDTGRFISGDARSIDAERLRSNDPRSSDVEAAQIKRSTFARYNVIGYIPLHYLHKTVNFHT